MPEAIDPIVPGWPAPAGVRAAFSTRAGGISTGRFASLNIGRSTGDESERVDENRRRLFDALSLPRPPEWIRQVHGDRVVQVPATPAEPEADAAFTVERGVVCAVQAADCLPVLFCDAEARVVAAAHAGWRGLASGILEATVAAMPASPSRIIAWIGPGIGPEAFEVGSEVREAFVANDPEAAACFVAAPATGKHFGDLFALARRRLRLAGVSSVHGGGISTHADPARFYSYRRDGGSGRMVAMIWLT